MSNNSNPGSVPLLSEFSSSELLDLLADGAYITDTDRRIVLWNSAAERITGWASQQVVGRTCYDNVLVHEDKDGHALCGNEHCPLHRSIVTNNPSAEPFLIFARHRDGHRVPVEVMVAPIRNREGKVTGGVELFRDLTASMQDQLRAKRIQEVSVQCDLPKDSRVSIETLYEPRDLVGGDTYRIERLDADTYAILVADAMGHGVAAALYTMQLQTLWEQHRAELPRPSQFVAAANRKLHALMHGEGYFGTAVCATFNAASRSFDCVRAGHPAPLIFRNSGAVERIGAANPALGLFAEVPWRESSHVLEPGEVLLLFTDGATEVTDRVDQDLGPEGLIRLVQNEVPPNRLASLDLRSLQRRLLEYSNQIHLADDLTLVKLSPSPPDGST